MFLQPLFAYPFRLFFLLASLYALLLIVSSAGVFLGGWNLPLAGSPLVWHSHEMLYGFVAAATAGFILTAITNWTPAPPLKGFGLFGLGLLWIFGRLCFWLDTGMSTTLIAIVDAAFLVILSLYVAWVLKQHGNSRNYILVAVLALFAVGNISIHIGLVSNQWQWVHWGTLHGLNLITLMMVIISGRLIPAFTRNWLRGQQRNHSVKQAPALEVLTLASIVSLLAMDWLNPGATTIGLIALSAAIINLLRLSQWQGWRTLQEPLLWILHLAYLWIVAALLLRALVSFVPSLHYGSMHWVREPWARLLWGL